VSHHSKSDSRPSCLNPSSFAAARRRYCLRLDAAKNELNLLGTTDELYYEDDEGDDDDEEGPAEDWGTHSLLEIYASNKKWLERATDVILEHPQGELRPGDGDNIETLMAAWAKRRSVEGAVSVERLLKRIVDDIRVNNQDVQVTARMYALVRTCSSLENLEATACTIFLK
jgi:hypothetical protein